MKILRLIPCAMILSTGAIAPALAAGPAPSYNAGTAIKEAAPPPPPVERPHEIPALPGTEEPALELGDGETLHVREFRLTGVEFADEGELLALVAPYRDQDLSLGQILVAANAITTFYRDRGYLLAKAYVPQQDARDGILTIKVVVGKYGQITLVNDSPVADFMLGGIMQGATEDGGGPIRKPALERAMLLASDLAGARMPTVNTIPGAAPGTTDLLIEAKGVRQIEGYMMGDNYGSRYTGRRRLNGGLVINSPLALGDRLSLTGQTSTAAGLQTGRAAYALPIGFDGLRAELAISRITYKLGDQYKDLEAVGHADIAEGTLSYPIIRSNAESLYATANLGAKRMQDKVWDETFSQRKAVYGRWGLRNETLGTVLGLDLTTNASALFTTGRVGFYDAAERAANESGAHTVGDFTKLENELGGTLGLTEDLSLSMSLKTQKAIGKNLDSSEQMSISGQGGVIGYAPGLMADNGYLYNSELKYVLPSFMEQHWQAVGIFVDTGRVYIEDSEYTTGVHSYRGSDIGLGYYTRFEYADDRFLVANLKFVQNLGPTPDGAEVTRRFKLLGQIGLTF